MSSGVLDASALLALLNGEPGDELVAAVVARGAAIGAVNLSEVVAKLAEGGMSEATIHDALAPLGLAVIDFDAGMAYRTAMLRPLTRAAGLSLGDRACLALAHHLNLPALTADHTWAGLSLPIAVRVIRQRP